MKALQPFIQLWHAVTGRKEAPESAARRNVEAKIQQLAERTGPTVRESLPDEILVETTETTKDSLHEDHAA